MTVSSIFWDTNGTGDGAAAYTEAQLAEWLRKTFLSDPANEGVVTGIGGEFAVTGTSSPLTVASGFAYVYGFPAWDNGSINLAVPTPLIGTTGHRVVLRASWAAQTVRVVLLSSSDGVATPPAVTQTAGTTWDISLATLTITTGGVIAVTDTRARAHFNTRVKNSMIDPGAVSPDKLSAGAVVAHLGFTPLNKAGDSATGRIQVVTSPAIDNSLFSNAQFESQGSSGAPAAVGFHRAGLDAVALYFNGGLDLRVRSNSGADGKLWSELNDGDASGLDADKVAGVDIAPIRRQGGDAANWLTAGSTNYAPANFRIEVGRVQVSISDGSTSGSATVTLPVAFAGTPLVLVTGTSIAAGTSLSASASASVVTITANRSGSGGVASFAVSWLAIGPA